MKTMNKTDKKGFTIIETLVAISILTLSLTGPLLIITQALKASNYSRNEIAAFYLAQEAIEHIRNLRDETSLTSVPDTAWLDGITGGVACAAAGTCVNDYLSAPIYTFGLDHSSGSYAFASCGSGECAPLLYDNSVGGDAIPYGGNGASNSMFTRTIWLTTVPGDNPADPIATPPTREVVVHVEIRWKQGTTDSKFILEDHLLNWKLEK